MKTDDYRLVVDLIVIETRTYRLSLILKRGNILLSSYDKLVQVSLTVIQDF